jgi:hypothetical protein
LFQQLNWYGAWQTLAYPSPPGLGFAVKQPVADGPSYGDLADYIFVAGFAPYGPREDAAIFFGNWHHFSPEKNTRSMVGNVGGAGTMRGAQAGLFYKWIYQQ